MPSKDGMIDRPVSGYSEAIDLIVHMAQSDYGLTCERTSPESAVIYFPVGVDWGQIESEIDSRVSDICARWNVGTRDRD